MLKIKEKVKECFQYKVGNGKKFVFPFDHWLYGKSIVDRMPELSFCTGISKTATVAYFWRAGHWSLPLTMSAEMAQIWDFVRTVNLSSASDSILWNGSQAFTVKRAWNCLQKPAVKIRVDVACLVWWHDSMV